MKIIHCALIGALITSVAMPPAWAARGPSSSMLRQVTVQNDSTTTGLEEGLRFSVFRSTLQTWAAAAILGIQFFAAPLAGQVKPPADAPRRPIVDHTLSPLRRTLGPGPIIGLITGGHPREIVTLAQSGTNLFTAAVTMGFDAVFLSGELFTVLTPQEQQRIMDLAAAASLPTVGFVNGSYTWGDPREAPAVLRQYQTLTGQLLALDLKGRTVSFAVNAELHHIAADDPQYPRWDGDMAGLMDMFEDVVVPAVRQFEQIVMSRRPGAPSVVRGPVADLAPWWRENGQPVDPSPSIVPGGAIVSGLRKVDGVWVPAATYRTSAAELAAVAQPVQRRVRAGELSGFGYIVETLPRATTLFPQSPAETDAPTFFGQPQRISEVLVGAVGAIPADLLPKFGGAFVHALGPKAAFEQVINPVLRPRALSAPPPVSRPPLRLRPQPVAPLTPYDHRAATLTAVRVDGPEARFDFSGIRETQGNGTVVLLFVENDVPRRPGALPEPGVFYRQPGADRQWPVRQGHVTVRDDLPLRPDPSLHHFYVVVVNHEAAKQQFEAAIARFSNGDPTYFNRNTLFNRLLSDPALVEQTGLAVFTATAPDRGIRVKSGLEEVEVQRQRLADLMHSAAGAAWKAAHTPQ
ncbi:MAG: hypothetical protein HY600_01485, partial [Candidatus Omnitrophica bacterium]|nr:hypothetical protein [Candidatus Omnitrophota bacterium]